MEMLSSKGGEKTPLHTLLAHPGTYAHSHEDMLKKTEGEWRGICNFSTFEVGQSK